MSAAERTRPSGRRGRAGLSGAAHLLVLLIAAPAFAQGTTVAVVGDTITLSVGSADGVCAGVTGKLRLPAGAAGAAGGAECATFLVTDAAEHTSEAAVTALAPGCTVAPGMEVAFDEPLAPVAAAQPAPPRPWAADPEGSPAFNPQEAAAPCPAVLDTLRVHCLILQGIARAEQPPNPADELRNGDALAAAGDWDGAAAAWKLVASVDPDYPGLQERLRKLVPVPGQRRRFAPSGAEFVFLPPGRFLIGCVPGDLECSADESPRHEVAITRGLWVAATPTTLGQYREFATATARTLPPPAPFPQTAEHPMVTATWDDALAYCTWAGGRLPTEAEWEYAARGGSEGLRYPWGDRATRADASFARAGAGDQDESTVPVGSYRANGFGLFDMAGNVWEWCADWYDADYYASSPPADPPGPPHGSARVLRGGSWMFHAGRLRASARDKLAPASRSDDVGFRCVRDAEP